MALFEKRCGAVERAGSRTPTAPQATTEAGREQKMDRLRTSPPSRLPAIQNIIARGFCGKEIWNRGGAISGRRSLPFGTDFRCRSAVETGTIFSCGQRNFLGAAMAFVTLVHRHLWRTYHSAETQEKAAIFQWLAWPYASHRRSVYTLSLLLIFSTDGGRANGKPTTGCVCKR